MKHGNSLENSEDVHQISGYCGPVLGAVVSGLSVWSCVVVVCRLCITAQIVLRLTARLAFLETTASHGNVFKCTSSERSNLETMQLLKSFCSSRVPVSKKVWLTNVSSRLVMQVHSRPGWSCELYSWERHHSVKSQRLRDSAVVLSKDDRS